jgi:hypothetical protein
VKVTAPVAFTVPFTSNVAAGVVVPMPTLLLVVSTLTILVIPSALLICTAVVESEEGYNLGVLNPRLNKGAPLITV